MKDNLAIHSFSFEMPSTAHTTQLQIDLLAQTSSTKYHKAISLNSPFSKQEFKNAIAKCFSSFTPGLDHVFWRYLKSLIANNKCLKKIICITNIYTIYEF